MTTSETAFLLFYWTSVFLSVALQAHAFRSLARRVRRGDSSRLRAVLLYPFYALLPCVGVAAVFMLLVGLEEWSRAAIIPEPAARVLLLVLALLASMGILGWLAFGARVVFVRTASSSPLTEE